MPTFSDLCKEAYMKPLSSYKKTGPRTAAIIVALARWHGVDIGICSREHYNAAISRKSDAYGILDLEAISKDSDITRGIQACNTGSDWRKHIDKLRYERYAECKRWLSSPYRTLEMWGWGERRMILKNGKKGKRYEPVLQVQNITMAFLDERDEPQMIDVLSNKYRGF